jgi:hypothetical protein
LEQVEQQETVIFGKALFKRVLFLPAPAAPPKGRHQKTPLGQMWQQKMVVFRKALFLESLVFICHTCPKDRACHSKRSYSRQMVCKIFYFMGFQGVIFML